MELNHNRPYIDDTALAIILGGSENRRYSWVKRSLKKGALIRLKRGIYLVEKQNAPLVDSFELAQQLYGPSYVSFESALAHHGWIPEAVYTTTSASSKRGQAVQTPLGMFSYKRTPQHQFFMGVERISTPDSTFLMAHPWKALADYMYVHRKNWQSWEDIVEDLRLDESAVYATDKNVLKEISEYYDSPRVRHMAKMILKSLKALK